MRSRYALGAAALFAGLMMAGQAAAQISDAIVTQYKDQLQVQASDPGISCQVCHDGLAADILAIMDYLPH